MSAGGSGHADGPARRGADQVVRAVGADGEQPIEDVVASPGRDQSLGASLDYGFREAFSEEKLPCGYG